MLRVVMLASMVKEKLKSVAFLTLCILLVACGPQTPPPAIQQRPDQRFVEAADDGQGPDEAALTVAGPNRPVEKIKIAIMLPLSGSESATGKALLRAAVTALFDAYDPRLVLLPLDTEADIDQTRIMAERAIEEDVDIVLGPLLAGNFVAAANILEPASIPIIGFTNDSSAAAAGRFIMGFMPETEVKRVVDYALTEGLLEYAALIPDGRYGARVRIAFGGAVTSGGATVAAIETYPPDPSALIEPVKRLSNYDKRRKDMRDEIRFLRSLGDDLTDEIAADLDKQEVLKGITYDAVLLPEGGELLRTLGPLLPFYEIDPNKVKLLGTGLWSDPGLLREPPLQGAWFAAPSPSVPAEFLKRLEDNFREPVPRIATLAYDAVSLVAFLSRDDKPADGSSRYAATILMNEKGFSGLDGLFRFLPDGTIERSLAVLEVHRRGFKVVDPAPSVFPSFGYALRQPASPK